MKQVKFLFIAVIVLLITACDDDKKNEEVTVTDGTYKGTLIVDQNDDTFYTQENVTVILNTGTDNAEIKMMQVSFSSKMPVTLDMTIPSITKAEVIDGLQLSGDNIIPLAMGGEFPRYTITGMTGKATPQVLALQFTCGEYPLTFSGVIVTE